ncbi:hypothetical protein WA588_001774 [Blastocystis sp. NMH]
MSQSALSICVRLSRKAYYPGGVVGGIITLEPIRASDEGEYLSFISVQLHGHIGVVPNMAVLPPEFRADRKIRSEISYGNITKFINDNTDCFYQTNPVIIDGDIAIKSIKAYFFQVTLPESIPPSMKTSCVRYFHLLSFCFSDQKNKSHFLSIPVTVLTPSSYKGDSEYIFSVSPLPLETPSYTKDISEVLLTYILNMQEYQSNSSVIVSEEIPETVNEPADERNLLEFKSLSSLDVEKSTQCMSWAQSHIFTSYAEYVLYDPNDPSQFQDGAPLIPPKPQCGIFSITHNSKVICNMQLQTTPLLLGDTIQLAASFADTEIPCEQMIISLHYEEYSPYLKGRIVRSDVVNSITVNTRSIRTFPFSFSVPPMYPPTIKTPQVTVSWKLCFSFFFNPKWETRVVPEEASCYMFEPEEYLGQNLTKIDWNYDLPVVSCVNEHLGEKLGVQDRFEGREEVTFVCSVYYKQQKPPQSL